MAATLSFLVPGLGQISLGHVRRGLLLAVPMAVTVLLLIVVLDTGPTAVLGLALREDVLVALLVANVLLAGYHVVAVLDAERTAAREAPVRRRTTGGASLAVTLLVVATVGLHGLVEAVGFRAYAAADDVFGAPGPDGAWAIPAPSFETDPPTARPSPTPTLGPTASATLAPTDSPMPVRTPAPTPVPAWAEDGRLDLLLIGSDAGPGRWSLRTDTVIILSVDVASGQAALFGFPRNMTGIPLPPESQGAFWNGRYPGMLNALYVYAMSHPTHFPGGDARGFRAVAGAIQELAGVPLDGAVVVDLRGFVKLVDAIDGLWIDIPERVVDDHYPLENGRGSVRIAIKAGCRHLDGHTALAYARSRHQDSDYGRMERQQLVLVALARQVDPIGLLPAVPKLIKIAGDHLWTTIHREDVGDLARLASRVDRSSVERVTFVPSTYPSHLTTASIKRIRKVVRSAFDDVDLAADPTATPAPSDEPKGHCG